VFFLRHKKGPTIDDFVIPIVVKLIFDATAFVRTVGDFRLGCMDDILFPLKDIKSDLSCVLFIVADEDVEN
jgi:hypothetical protein